MDPAPSIAIVVPVGPGDDAWRALLPDLAPLAGRAELVLVATSGDEQSVSALDDAGIPARRRVSPTGRARQQNVGASASSNAWLWFLHADSRVPRASIEALLRAIDAADAANDGTRALHYFDLCFLDDGPRWMWINALGARVRARLFGLPFGDQGLLVRRDAFERIGGFDESVPYAEDVALVRRARSLGIGVRAIGAPLSTSARTYARGGWLATTASHLWLTWHLARGRYPARPASSARAGIVVPLARTTPPGDPQDGASRRKRNLP